MSSAVRDREADIRMVWEVVCDYGPMFILLRCSWLGDFLDDGMAHYDVHSWTYDITVESILQQPAGSCMWTGDGDGGSGHLLATVLSGQR